MRKVILRVNSNPPRLEVIATLLRLILVAIAESPFIEELFLRNVIEVTPEAFAFLVRTTQSLKTLDIWLGTFDGATSRELGLIAEAFGVNRSLESLTIQSVSSTDVVESILLNIGSHPRLCKLTLQRGPTSRISQIHALARFLFSTTSLEYLDLSRYEFDKECMELLVAGLRSNQSVARLLVTHCKFDVEATNVFHSFMQMGDSMSSIRELCFRGTDGMFAGSTTGKAVASMLIMPENQHSGSCVGSSLQVLDFDDSSDNCDFAGFCDSLAANANRILLPCLRHACIADVASWEELVLCLPELVHLRELHIREVSHQDFIV